MSKVTVHKCDDCGCIAEGLDPELVYEANGSIDYGKIARTGEPQETLVYGWRIIARQCDDDGLVIDLDHYCPDCEDGYRLNK